MITVGISLLIGAPLAFLFLRNGWLKLWQSIVTGAAIGACVGAAFNTHIELSEQTIHLLKFAALGSLHTAAFWVLAFWKKSSLQRSQAHENASSQSSGAA
jgi:hypothetical protein